MFNMAPIVCESEEQFEKILKDNAEKLIVVDFTAVWCPPCQMIAPIFAKLSEEHPDAVFIKVDVDKQRDIATKYDVSAMPTFVFIKDNKQLDKLVGASVDELTAKIIKNK